MRDILFAAVKVAIAALANLLGWMVAVKIISLQLGAAGVGLFGILRQLLQNLLVLATLAGHTALIQGIASRMEGPHRRYAESVQAIIALMAAGIAAILFVGAPLFAHRLVPHPQAVALLRWLALAVLCMAAQTIYTSVLTGYRLLNQLVLSQLVGPVSVMLMVLPTIWLVRSGAPAGYVLMLGFPGAMIALASAWAARRSGCLPGFRLRVAREDAVSFSRMSIVLLATGLVTTGSQYFLSRIVALRLGLDMAGHYWVAWTVSMAYITLALGSFGNYYMPSLSRLSEPEARRSLMRSYLRMALIAMPVLVSLVILFKPLVIRVMFSASLLPALKVMRWMLIGDLFKGVSWVLSFPMLAFNEMKWYFWTEVGFTVSMAGFGWLLLAAGGGVEWLGVQFLLLYLCYAAVMVVYGHVSLGFHWRLEEIVRLACGAGLVLFLSALTWKHQAIHWDSVAVGLASIALYSAFSLKELLSRRKPTASLPEQA